MDLDEEGFTKIQFKDLYGNENPLFIRLFENGAQVYDQNRIFPVKNTVVFSFPDKNGKIVEKRRKVCDGEQSESLVSFVVCLHAYMRIEGNIERSEALEIIQTPEITYINAREIPRSFITTTGCISLASDFVDITMTFNN